MIWITSDQHFGHANILNYTYRPFKNIDEMNEALIENWNSRVQSNDIVKVLGDLFWNPSIARRILPSLNGRIHLIVGNHDVNWQKYWKNNDLFHYFDLIQYIHEFKYNNVTYICCHYPMLSWDKKFYGAKHLFGHTHGNKQDHIKIEGAFHVGVDTNDYAPVHIEEIETYFLNEAKIK